ncbi:MAG: hypothetical protein ACRDYA_14175 [Egibacteraceae bacterium]
MFAETVRRLLRRGLAVFEAQVWKDTTRPLVLVILDTEVVLTGPHLAVIDGGAIGNIDELCAQFQPDSKLVQTMVTGRVRQIGWDTTWTRGLVPEHFDTAGSCADAELKALLDPQLVKLAVLYTCDRDRNPEPLQIRAEYRGAEHAATVVIDETAALSDIGRQSLQAVVNAVNWCYQPMVEMPERSWFADRLPIMQIKVAQALEGQENAQRLRSFAEQMPEFFEGVFWSWKAFLEEKLPKHFEEVQRLESAVADTVAKHAQTANELVKKPTDTMLAAVATLIGSVIAAAFSRHQEDHGRARFGSSHHRSGGRRSPPAILQCVIRHRAGAAAASEVLDRRALRGVQKRTSGALRSGSRVRGRSGGARARCRTVEAAALPATISPSAAPGCSRAEDLDPHWCGAGGNLHRRDGSIRGCAFFSH